MLRMLLVGLVSLSAPFLPAQDPSPAANQNELLAARARLDAALRKTASLQDVAFEASWGPADKKANAPRQLLAPQGGTMRGSWHADGTIYRSDRDSNDELLVTGRGALARDDERDWCLRSGRFADGAPVAYLPMLPMLLRHLAGQELAVVRREVGTLDDLPVEIVTVTLNPDQATELLRSGLLPIDVSNETGLQGMRFRIVQAGAKGPATMPEATIDVAITLDPALSLVRDLHWRCWTKQDGRGGAFVFVQGGAVDVRADQGDDEQEADAPAPADGAQPPGFRDHLPVRPKDKHNVTDVRFRLTNHGTTTAPTISPEQQRLLGR